jgi:bilirubin oxidase
MPPALLTRKAYAALPGGDLDAQSIPKYQQALIVPPAMPGLKTRGFDSYAIAVRQFAQQILPPSMPATTVWSYGSALHPETFNYPAFTIEARWKKPVLVKWINGLVDRHDRYLPHLLPVDPTLHWANPPGGKMHRDMRPEFSETPGPYTGPVPIVTHVHGAHTGQESDGYPEAWYLPSASNIPAGYARTGTFYDAFKRSSPLGALWGPGWAVFRYPNDQRATTLWYHDHTLGMTRANVYAGPAGFYLLRGGPDDHVRHGKLPGPPPGVGDDPFGTYYEIPLAIQDRSFNADGSLFYPDSREFFDGIAGPYVPTSDVSPIWNPEFFGNTMVVNGRTWPYLEVEQRRYRLRILNGCNSRFLILRMSNGAAFWQIGAEGGFLPEPVELSELLMAPAERADVIVDFTHCRVGTEIILQNVGPDEPFGGGVPGTDFPVADPDTTGQVMQFRVVSPTGVDTSTEPGFLKLPKLSRLGKASVTRGLSLNEMMSMFPGFDGPAAALLGTMQPDGSPKPLMWMDEVTERPKTGATEIWELHNFTEDAHPIHIHQVQFEVVNRENRDTGEVRGPEEWEKGQKDTVIAYPGELTRVKARFDIPGLFVWHCHIVEHEDNEMMRPYRVG